MGRHPVRYNTIFMSDTTSARKPRVAILEDEAAMCTLLRRILGTNYDVVIMGSSSELLEAIKHEQIDLALLDIVLPGENGIEIAKSIRARSRIPIVLLSGLSASETVVTGLNIGANDYITKPFDPEILKARISNALRMGNIEQKQSTEPRVIQANGVTIDPWKRAIETAAGESIHVTEMEVQLFSILCNNSPNIVTRDELSKSLIGKKWQPEVRALDVHISHLRTKLQKIGFPKHQIICHRGVGYSMQLTAPKK